MPRSSESLSHFKLNDSYYRSCRPTVFQPLWRGFASVVNLGDGSAEIELGHVTVDKMGHSKYNLNENNSDLPKAWFEFHGAEITLDLLNSAASIC